ncbi:MAG: hypothetical protein MK110_12830 [Fuerstiella sp.]|nr:hypothetical protein [Fuerstiella sp.]
MTNPPTASIINEALIGLARSFLQYVAESWPWVDVSHQSIEKQLQLLAARQREDVSELVQLLIDRELPIDIGVFPTEYTDLHFISLVTLLDWLQIGQSRISDRLAAAAQSLRESADEDALDLIEAIAGRQQNLAASLRELQQELEKITAES